MTAAALEDVDGVAVEDLGHLRIVSTLDPQAGCGASHRAVKVTVAVRLIFSQIETVGCIYEKVIRYSPVCFAIVRFVYICIIIISQVFSSEA